MKILVTGATGYIGNNLAHKLAGMGNEVLALARSASAKTLLRHPNITIFKADILEKEKLSEAMEGCQQVYHTAGMVGLWSKDPADFYDVNVEGTRNVLDAAFQTGIERTVFTSTCGVIGPSLNVPMNEKDPRITCFGIDYELSKKMGEDLAFQYAKAGMNVIVVSPSKVFGPGNISHPLTANAMIEKFLKKGIALVPATGDHKVCCAFIGDIVNGHLLAMKKGKAGEKYILGGINISYHDFYDRIRTLSSCNGRIIPLPRNAMKGLAVLQLLNYKITGSRPQLTVKAIDHLLCDYTFSSEKAIRELGYRITPLEEALTKTIHFLNNKYHA